MSAKPTACETLEDAARVVIYQRDYGADNGGQYDTSTFHPDKDQLFDDWAADILETVLGKKPALPANHPRVTGPAKDMASRLRGVCRDLKVKPSLAVDWIPMLQQAADLLDNGGMPRETRTEPGHIVKQGGLLLDPDSVKPMPRYVVDGSTTPERLSSVFDSDPKIGKYPPFVVFDTQEQENVGAEYEDRAQAQMACDLWNQGNKPSEPELIHVVYVVAWDGPSSGGHDWFYDTKVSAERYVALCADPDYKDDHIRHLMVRVDPPIPKLGHLGPIERYLRPLDADGFQLGTHIKLFAERKPVDDEVHTLKAQPNLISKKQHMRKVVTELTTDMAVEVLLAGGIRYRGLVAETPDDNVLALCTKVGNDFEYVEFHESVIAAVVVHK